MSITINQSFNRQSGFGLVELMIGVLISMIIMAAASTALLSSVTSNRDSIKMSRLDQELRQVMTMISRDLRRASAWDAAVDVTRVSIVDPLTLSSSAVGSATATSTGGHLGDIGSKANGGTLIYYNGTTVYQATIGTFDGTGYPVTISTAWPATVTTADGVPAGSWTILRPQSVITKSGDCILFNYDTDGSGTYTTSSPLEFFGYRHINTVSEKVVKIKTASTGDCTTSTTGWQNLTDENTIDITTFSITDNTSSQNISPGFDVAVREYTISITGNLKSEPSVERTLKETIRVRNDRLS